VDRYASSLKDLKLLPSHYLNRDRGPLLHSARDLRSLEPEATASQKIASHDSFISARGSSPKCPPFERGTDCQGGLEAREALQADKKERRKRKEKYETKKNKGRKEKEKNKDIYGYFTILSTMRSYLPNTLSELPGTKLKEKKLFH